MVKAHMNSLYQAAKFSPQDLALVIDFRAYANSLYALFAFKRWLNEAFFCSVRSIY